MKQVPVQASPSGFLLKNNTFPLMSSVLFQIIFWHSFLLKMAVMVFSVTQLKANATYTLCPKSLGLSSG